MALNFLKYAEEGQHFVNDLAADLGHPWQTEKLSQLFSKH